MTELTEEMLLEAIKNCKWRQDFQGTPICAGNVVPCQLQIETGKCTTLLELVAKHRKEVYDNHFSILLFFQGNLDRNRVFDILQKFHGFNLDVDFIDIDLMLGPTADSDIINKVAQMIAHGQYQEYYIIPEQRKLRQALKKLLEEKTGEELDDFKLYKKVAEGVDRRSRLK